MNSLFQLDIPKRHGQCAQQGERLLPGMDIYSLILENEEQGLIRKDFCLDCWKQVSMKERANSIVRAYWKSKIEERKILEKSSRIEKVFSLLKFLQKNSEAYEAEIFVLALFLSHARQLILRQEFYLEDQLYYLYEILRKEEFIKIKVMSLSQLQTENLQKSLAHQLQSF